ncbi:MAG: MFS transporter [Rhodospirillaceae bacterium]|jgi:MFS family permease|nr:MFS transporter [Rhodospirillaceae bacterium]
MRSWRTPTIVLFCGTMILLLTFGVRQTYGLLLAPISEVNGWPLGVFSLSMALQVLIWGFSTPILGGIADRYGAGRVASMGLLLYAGGLWMMAEATTVAEIHFSTGFLTGIGMSACGFPIILAVVGRSVGAERRSLFLGIASAGGSSGQVIVVPIAQYFITGGSYAAALIAMAIALALVVPLVAAVSGKPQRPDGAGIDQSVFEAVGEALRHRGFVLLVAGFFVCGYQTMFIGAHLPNFLKEADIGPGVAATCVALIGFFNIVGCWIWGALGGRYSKKLLLAILYLARSAGIALFITLPITDVSAILFASYTGLLWLGTIPLTSGLVAQIFGVQYMAMLYGFAFLSHQVGSFLGIWMGGAVRDFSGSYDAVWWCAVGLGFVAAAIHWPIDERPVARMTAQTSTG